MLPLRNVAFDAIELGDKGSSLVWACRPAGLDRPESNSNLYYGA